MNLSIICLQFILGLLYLNYGGTVIVCPTQLQYCLHGSSCHNDPIDTMTISDYLQYLNYTSTEYNYTTSDGYVNKITYVYKGNVAPKKNIVLLLGLFMTRWSFVDNGQNSVARPLLEANYGVLLPCFRGCEDDCKYNLNFAEHTKRFYNFSMDDIADNDVKAILEKTYEITKNKFVVLGYSMGGGVSSMFLSRNIDYQKNIIGLVYISPAIYLHDSSLQAVSSLYVFGKAILETFTTCEIRFSFVKMFSSNCVIMAAKEYGGQLIFGPTTLENWNTLSITQALNWGSTSCNVISQFKQIMLSNVFGRLKKDIFSPDDPYLLSNIKLPVVFFTSLNDRLIPSNAQKKAYGEFPKKCGLYYLEGYNHVGQINAENTPTEFHPRFMKKVNQIFDEICDASDSDYNP